MDAAGTLGGASCAVCPLEGVGSGARVGGVVWSGTLGGIRGVGSNCTGQANVSTIAVSLSSGMVELTMVDSCWRACIWSSTSARKGDTGAGCASVSILAASTALSSDDVVGILIS